MEAVARALRAMADAGSLPVSPAGNGVERVIAAIAAARREAAVVRDDAAGRDFVDRLGQDPMASLEIRK